MTIRKEERAEWRKRLNARYSDPCRETGETRDFSLRLLDALEAAEARAEATERERDALAELLEKGVAECPLEEFEPESKEELPFCTGVYSYEYGLDCNGGSAECWIKWAHQQARGGENA